MIIDFLRKSYAKVTQMWNEHEKEMVKWAQMDPEAHAFYIHYYRYAQEVT